MNISTITTPLVGGLIGVVTNGLAIWMLFRPLKPVYIGKLKLPFTPGLIPKEKSRIARAIGDVVSRNLLDKETLRSTLLSEQMKQGFYVKAESIINSYAETDETIISLTEKLLPEISVQEKICIAEKSLTEIIAKKAIEQNIGKSIADYLYKEIVSKSKPLVKTLTSGALNSIKQPFAMKVNNMIGENAGPVVGKFIEEQSDQLLEMPLKEMIEKHRGKIPETIAYLWGLYESLIINKLDDILVTVNISEVIYNKINDLELPELEKMIMMLMKRELSALIWLGGLLGIIMGFINVIPLLLK